VAKSQVFFPFKMTKLWVKYKINNSTQVSTEECHNVDDFLEACKKKLQIPNPPQELSLSTTDGFKFSCIDKSRVEEDQSQELKESSKSRASIV
jgi:hypothetical protein